MTDSKAARWFHRKKSTLSMKPGSDQDSSSNNPDAEAPKFGSLTAEWILQSVLLALELADQAVDIAQVAPVVGPAAALLRKIIDSYKELKSTEENHDALVQRIADITGDICAAVLRMQETNHSDQIGRLKQDLVKYATLIDRASKFIKAYDDQGKMARFAKRDQMQRKMHQLNNELDSFGTGFANNRLVDLCIQDSMNTRTLNNIFDTVANEKLEKWLRSPPDMKEKQHDTEKLCMEGTGQWLLDSASFIEWEDNPGVLWIEGPTLDNQYNLVNGQKLPTYSDIQDIFHKLLQELGHTYVVLDALDECDSTGFEELVKLVLALKTRTETRTMLHLLITSQTRDIFTKSFREMNHITLEPNIMQEDIKCFVTRELQMNPKLEAWEPAAALVAERITEKSNGMFRLAMCLLTELSRCIYGEDEDLEQTLKTLPNDLFGIYDRFILAIPREHLLYAKAALRWIMFHRNRCFHLAELADAIAFKFSDQAGALHTYKPNRWNTNTTALLKWLAGLIQVDGSLVVLAHASVQDYLLSAHFKKEFSCDLSEKVSHRFISQSCISYLLYFSHNYSEDGTVGKYPLREYAANNWYHHLSQSDDKQTLLDLAMQLLWDGTEQYHALCSWTRGFLEGGFMPPLHFCCKQGYSDCVSRLLASRADIDIVAGKHGSPLSVASWSGNIDIIRILLENSANVNLMGGQYDSPLVAASLRHNVDIVCLLLKNSANINQVTTEYGSALAAAAFHHAQIDIVQLLIESGANVNLACGKHGSALIVACDVAPNHGAYKEHVKIAHLLLRNGADVNLAGGKYGSALSTASYWGAGEMVELLLSYNADVNIAGGKYNGALVAACASPYWKPPTRVVTLLLKNGVDIQAQGSCALQKAAVMRGGEKIVTLLKEHGALLD
ncbi:ankyrin repeat-containing domain protein [Mycena haematopus]|nr:ankyrin repeat-containing domain protein [Mycena haematopus]